MRTIVDALGHPERSYPTIHVAGTNGKGSVTAMVDSALRAAGFHSGRYTSPHLVDLNERFVIDGRPIAAAPLDAAIDRPALARRGADRRRPPRHPADLFRGDHRDRVRAVQERRRGRGGLRGRHGRTPRRHQRAHPAGHGDHLDRPRPPAVSRQLAARDRGRKGRHHQDWCSGHPRTARRGLRRRRLDRRRASAAPRASTRTEGCVVDRRRTR